MAVPAVYLNVYLKTVAGDRFQWNSENEKSGSRPLFPWLPGVQWALVEANMAQRTRLEHNQASQMVKLLRSKISVGVNVGVFFRHEKAQPFQIGLSH